MVGPDFASEGLVTATDPLPVVIPVNPAAVETVNTLVEVADIKFEVDFAVFNIVLSAEVSVWYIVRAVEVAKVARWRWITFIVNEPGDIVTTSPTAVIAGMKLGWAPTVGDTDS